MVCPPAEKSLDELTLGLDSQVFSDTHVIVWTDWESWTLV
jgi:hypothetical protein